MKIRFRWHWSVWSLIPSIGIRCRNHALVFEWLCASLWLENTVGTRCWDSKYVTVSVGHSPTNQSLPTLRVSFRNSEINIRVSVLGFWLSLYITIGENDDLPF